MKSPIYVRAYRRRQMYVCAPRWMYVCAPPSPNSFGGPSKCFLEGQNFSSKMSILASKKSKFGPAGLILGFFCRYMSAPAHVLNDILEIFRKGGHNFSPAECRWVVWGCAKGIASRPKIDSRSRPPCSLSPTLLWRYFFGL